MERPLSSDFFDTQIMMEKPLSKQGSIKRQESIKKQESLGKNKRQV